jgi:hypothetical protein
MGIGLSMAIAACSLSSITVMGAAAGEKPTLSKLLPDNGPAGTAYPLQVTIQGTGFAATENVVQFGPMRLPGVPSADGRTIVFQVPKEMRGRGEVPPLVFGAGDYDVVVTTPAGASNALLFKLTPGA